LQRASGHANDLSDLVSAPAPLYEVPDLLHSFWRKLCWSSATRWLRCELNDVTHGFNFLPSGPPVCSRRGFGPPGDDTSQYGQSAERTATQLSRKTAEQGSAVRKRGPVL